MQEKAWGTGSAGEAVGGAGMVEKMEVRRRHSRGGAGREGRDRGKGKEKWVKKHWGRAGNIQHTREVVQKA
jgi:hypothetical protein